MEGRKDKNHTQTQSTHQQIETVSGFVSLATAAADFLNLIFFDALENTEVQAGQDIVLRGSTYCQGRKGWGNVVKMEAARSPACHEMLLN